MNSRNPRRRKKKKTTIEREGEKEIVVELIAISSVLYGILFDLMLFDTFICDKAIAEHLRGKTITKYR